MWVFIDFTACKWPAIIYIYSRRSGDKSRRRSPSPPSVKLPFPRRTRSPIGLGYNRSSPLEELSPEERDARTVFCMQLSQRIRARDLEEFFSSVGKVRDVRLITCNKTRRFKGIAYIEFRDPESVPLVSLYNDEFYQLQLMLKGSV